MSDAQETPAEYFARRHRERVDRDARRQEWDFLARALRPGDLTVDVGAGWYRLVRALHRRLLDIDPDYRFLHAYEKHGASRFSARFDLACGTRPLPEVAIAVAQAAHTCQVCGDWGRLRDERPRLKTLCDACWVADRALAAARDERYAEFFLDYVMSGDPEHPDPEAVWAWLEARAG